MKNFFYISQKNKKRISFFLLINFILYTFFVGFPKEYCDKICAANISEKCDCSSNGGMNCCNMMETKSKHNSANTSLRIINRSCSYEYAISENNSYVVPKINESKIELFISKEIIVEKEKLSFKNKFIFQNSFSDIGPPIYITVSSLLI